MSNYPICSNRDMKFNQKSQKSSSIFDIIDEAPIVSSSTIKSPPRSPPRREGVIFDISEPLNESEKEKSIPEEQKPPKPKRQRTPAKTKTTPSSTSSSSPSSSSPSSSSSSTSSNS